MAFDYKKEYKELYQPKSQPGLVTVPPMRFVAVRGQGDPNREDGPYKEAMGLLYGVVFTIKMSKLGSHRIEGYFDYVAPPLEDFQWISMIRLPDFVTRAEFDWAVEEAQAKKGGDFSRAEFFAYDEGLCVQCMHLGPYDNEPATLEKMGAFVQGQGYALDQGGGRYHHEIYLSDPRKCRPERLRTVIRQPVRLG